MDSVSSADESDFINKYTVYGVVDRPINYDMNHIYSESISSILSAATLSMLITIIIYMDDTVPSEKRELKSY